MTAPPRKRAPRKLAAVPEPTPEVEPEEAPKRKAPYTIFKERGGGIGKNRAHKLEQAKFNHGPDLAPGIFLKHLPSAEQVPPKPTTEPEMDYPGTPHRTDGHPEWALLTEFDEDENPIKRSWVVRWVPPEERRCKARTIGRTARYQGNRCATPAIKGGRVCKHHGGTLTNVKKAAQTALAMAALPAAEKLIHIAIKKSGVSDADRIKAIVQILDRAGVEGRQTVEIEIAPWQKVLERVYADGQDKTIDGELVEGEDYEVDDDEEPAEAGD
jgi:hypothetical protein